MLSDLGGRIEGRTDNASGRVASALTPFLGGKATAAFERIRENPASVDRRVETVTATWSSLREILEIISPLNTCGRVQREEE